MRTISQSDKHHGVMMFILIFILIMTITLITASPLSILATSTPLTPQDESDVNKTNLHGKSSNIISYGQTEFPIKSLESPQDPQIWNTFDWTSRFTFGDASTSSDKIGWLPQGEKHTTIPTTISFTIDQFDTSNEYTSAIFKSAQCQVFNVMTFEMVSESKIENDPDNSTPFPLYLTMPVFDAIYSPFWVNETSTVPPNDHFHIVCTSTWKSQYALGENLLARISNWIHVDLQDDRELDSFMGSMRVRVNELEFSTRLPGHSTSTPAFQRTFPELSPAVTAGLSLSQKANTLRPLIIENEYLTTSMPRFKPKFNPKVHSYVDFQIAIPDFNVDALGSFTNVLSVYPNPIVPNGSRLDPGGGRYQRSPGNYTCIINGKQADVRLENGMIVLPYLRHYIDSTTEYYKYSNSTDHDDHHDDDDDSDSDYDKNDKKKQNLQQVILKPFSMTCPELSILQPKDYQKADFETLWTKNTKVQISRYTVHQDSAPTLNVVQTIQLDLKYFMTPNLTPYITPLHQSQGVDIRPWVATHPDDNDNYYHRLRSFQLDIKCGNRITYTTEQWKQMKSLYGPRMNQKLRYSTQFKIEQQFFDQMSSKSFFSNISDYNIQMQINPLGDNLQSYGTHSYHYEKVPLDNDNQQQTVWIPLNLTDFDYNDSRHQLNRANPNGDSQKQNYPYVGKYADIFFESEGYYSFDIHTTYRLSVSFNYAHTFNQNDYPWVKQFCQLHHSTIDNQAVEQQQQQQEQQQQEHNVEIPQTTSQQTLPDSTIPTPQSDYPIGTSYQQTPFGPTMVDYFNNGKYAVSIGVIPIKTPKYTYQAFNSYKNIDWKHAMEQFDIYPTDDYNEYGANWYDNHSKKMGLYLKNLEQHYDTIELTLGGDFYWAEQPYWNKNDKLPIRVGCKSLNCFAPSITKRVGNDDTMTCGGDNDFAMEDSLYPLSNFGRTLKFNFCTKKVRHIWDTDRYEEQIELVINKYFPTLRQYPQKPTVFIGDVTKPVITPSDNRSSRWITENNDPNTWSIPLQINLSPAPGHFGMSPLSRSIRLESWLSKPYYEANQDNDYYSNDYHPSFDVTDTNNTTTIDKRDNTTTFTFKWDPILEQDPTSTGFNGKTQLSYVFWTINDGNCLAAYLYWMTLIPVYVFLGLSTLIFFLWYRLCYIPKQKIAFDLAQAQMLQDQQQEQHTIAGLGSINNNNSGSLSTPLLLNQLPPPNRSFMSRLFGRDTAHPLPGFARAVPQPQQPTWGNGQENIVTEHNITPQQFYHPYQQYHSPQQYFPEQQQQQQQPIVAQSNVIITPVGYQTQQQPQQPQQPQQQNTIVSPYHHTESQIATPKLSGAMAPTYSNLTHTPLNNTQNNNVNSPGSSRITMNQGAGVLTPLNNNVHNGYGGYSGYGY